MYNLLFIFYIINILIFIMLLICLFFSKKELINYDKLISFECGFNAKSIARIPFSLHFFMITVIFLIFDIEITLIFPIIYMMEICNNFMLIFISMFFLYLLLLGLLFEWNQGMLNWMN